MLPADEGIENLIAEGYLSRKDADGLTPEQMTNLANKNVQKLVHIKTLTIEQAINLTPQQRNNLSIADIRDLIKFKKLTLNIAINLNEDEVNLCIRLYHLIIKGYITFENARKLSPEQMANLANKNVQALIRKKILAIEQAENLPKILRNKITNKILRLVIINRINIEQVFTLNQDILRFLERDDIYNQIITRRMTIEVAIKMAN